MYRDRYRLDDTFINDNVIDKFYEILTTEGMSTYMLENVDHYYDIDSYCLLDDQIQCGCIEIYDDVLNNKLKKDFNPSDILDLIAEYKEDIGVDIENIHTLEVYMTVDLMRDVIFDYEPKSNLTLSENFRYMMLDYLEHSNKDMLNDKLRKEYENLQDKINSLDKII